MQWNQYLANPTQKMNTLHVLGKRWRDSFGNTYHTATIFVDGERFGESPITYGYGSHYLETAGKILEDTGIVKRRGNEPLWRTAERLGIPFTYEAVDVKRKKDL